jgi:hypothetical protein
MGYRLHETQFLSRPVFDPPGIKYAYAKHPEPGKIRGWVAGMTPPPKRPGISRIIALGDSVTFGLGTEAEAAWPAALERKLTHTEVFNLAMCGWDAEQSVSLAIGHLSAWQPDLVIWGTYTNDMLPSYLMWGTHDKHPVFVGTSIPKGVGILPEAMGLWLVRHTAIYRQFLAARMARAQAKGLQIRPQLAWYQAQLRRLEDWSVRANIPVLVLALPAHTQANPEQCPTVLNAHDCRLQAEAYRDIKAALSKTQLQWLDGQRFYAATGRSDFMVRPGESTGPGAWENDAEHPTAAGHAALAAGLTAPASAILQR